MGIYKVEFPIRRMPRNKIGGESAMTVVKMELTKKQAKLFFDEFGEEIMRAPYFSEDNAIIGQVVLRNDGSAHLSADLFQYAEVDELEKIVKEHFQKAAR
jgi:hypothetical protein